MSQPEDTVKVRVTGLNKAFGDNPVLRDIDLAIPAGKNSVLIGPAASGKSVLMKCLAGLYPLDSGRIEIAVRSDPRAEPLDGARLLDVERLAGGDAGGRVDQPDRVEAAAGRDLVGNRAAERAGAEDSDDGHARYSI